MAKQLRSDIIIGGKADASFYRLGAELEQLGSQVNLVSEKLITFGEEGVETYVSYEDAMLDAKSAWATQYKNVSDLNKVMQQAQKASLEWAASSVFTTQDVAEAISEAAHAGWTIEEVMAGVPAAMQIARAGSMGLSEGLEYMIDISHAAGIEFGDLGQLIDTWAYAANRSSTKIPEMGAAMQKMGATMQFVGGDMAALTTMLAVLANNGAKGTEAGTLLRNSFIRLVAPTKAAAEAMDELEISAADLEEIYSETEGLSEASKLLEEYGFNAYDSEGNLKNFLQIYEELNAAMSGMTEQQQNEILSAIFPTKTITAAKAFVSAAAKGWGGLYDDILKFSGGYAKIAADIMESGLGGTLRHFESLMDTLRTKTGEAIAPELNTWTDALSGLIENVNNMDSAAFNGWVSGLEVIATAGPALMTAGAAVKLMSFLFGTGAGGWMAIGTIGIAALANGIYSYISALDEAAYNDNFGTLALNTQEITEYLSGLNEGFKTAQTEIAGYQEAVDSAISQYETASSTMKESLLTKMLTGATLSDEDKAQIEALGQTVSDSLVAAINAGYQESTASLNLLAGDEAGTGIWAEMQGVIDAGFQESTARAEELSKQLRTAITSAFADGHITADEIANINSIYGEINEEISAQSRAKSRAEQERILRKAQTLGRSGLKETDAMFDALSADRAEDIIFDRDYSVEKILYAQERGAINPDTGEPWTDADINRYIDALYLRAEQNIAASNAENDAKKIESRKMLLAESDLSEVYSSAYDAWMEFERTGMISGALMDAVSKSGTSSQKNDLITTLTDAVDALGGEEAIISTINTLIGAGLGEAAVPYRELLGMWNIAGYAREMPFWDVESQYDAEDFYQLNGIPKIPVELISEVDEASLEASEEKISSLHPTITADVAVRQIGSIGAKVSSFVKSGFGKLFAEGGRADEASIFGEAGPEWAIPEEHTARTADLLRSAAEASGFTWPELLTNRNNSRSAGNWTVVYSPTINAGNADGVAEKLIEDKDRLLKWLKEKAFFEEVEVYA